MFTNFKNFNPSSLLAEALNLYVLFATYNEVSGYESGRIQKENGLTIQIQNGNLKYSDKALTFGPVGDMQGRIEAHEAQRAIERNLEIKDDETTSLIAVIYAGLSAIEEPIEMGRKIKHNHPSAKIVIVACDCDIRLKKGILEPLLKSKEIQEVVITDECGGRYTMKKMLDNITTAWSQVETV